MLIFSAWTKLTLYQNILSHIAFFFTLFKGYRYNQLPVIMPKTISFGSLGKKISNFTGIVKTQVKSLYARFHFAKIWSIWSLFSPAPIRTFPLEWFHITYYIKPLKSVKKDAIWLKLFWYKVFAHWKLKLLNFLMDSVNCYI